MKKIAILLTVLVALTAMAVGQTAATQQYDIIVRKIDGKLEVFTVPKEEISMDTYDNIPEELTAQEAWVTKSKKDITIAAESISSSKVIENIL